MPKSKPRRVAPICNWKLNKSNNFVKSDEKVLTMEFDRLLGNEKYKKHNTFFIKKISYIHLLPAITRYMNFFMDRYDPENEFATAYLKIKYEIDELSKYLKNKDRPRENGEEEETYNRILQAVDINSENEDEVRQKMGPFIDLIYELLFTPSICAKIRLMVSENYTDDIEQTDDEKFKKNTKEYLESLEFTNQHMEILLRISFGIKVMCPLIFHYFSINALKLTSDNTAFYLYPFYERLLPLFQDDVDIFNKLFTYVKSRVSENQSHNKLIHTQKEILGVDIFSTIRHFVRKVLFCEIIPRYSFTETWDEKKGKYKENIVGFNKTIIKLQLGYFLKDQFAKTMTEATNTTNSDGLSGIDKLEMNLNKIDEGVVIMAELNAKQTTERILEDIDVPITEEEIQYYRDHHYPSKVQVMMVYSMLAKYFNSYQDLKLLSRRQYLTLLLALKKKLILENGYRPDSDTQEVYLPYILTGNLDGKINNRLIRNSQYESELENDQTYEYLTNDVYKRIGEKSANLFPEIMSLFATTKFTYVVYEQPDLLGKPIEYDRRDIAYEVLRYIINI